MLNFFQVTLALLFAGLLFLGENAKSTAYAMPQDPYQEPTYVPPPTYASPTYTKEVKSYAAPNYETYEPYKPSGYASTYPQSNPPLVYGTQNYNQAPLSYGATYNEAKNYGPGYGQCEQGQTNCVIDCKIKCYGDYIEVKLEFARYFGGIIYVWNRSQDCILYSKPQYKEGSKTLTLKLTGQTCPSYGGFRDAYSEQYKRTNEEYKGRNFQIAIQFDPYLVSQDDVNFVARCERPEEGDRKVSFSYTVLDDYPTLLAGMLARAKLTIEVKKGSSPYGPNLYGPVKIGSFMTVVLKLRGYTEDYDFRVSNCWAEIGNPIGIKYRRKFYAPGYAKPGPIELIKNDCSIRPRLIGNFWRVSSQTGRDPYGPHYTLIKAATMKAFRFPKSDNVIIQCTIDVCYGKCDSYKCKPVVLYQVKSRNYGYSQPEPTLIPIDYAVPSGQTVKMSSSDDGYNPGSEVTYSTKQTAYQPAVAQYNVAQQSYNVAGGDDKYVDKKLQVVYDLDPMYMPNKYPADYNKEVPPYAVNSYEPKKDPAGPPIPYLQSVGYGQGAYSYALRFRRSFDGRLPIMSDSFRGIQSFTIDESSEEFLYNELRLRRSDSYQKIQFQNASILATCTDESVDLKLMDANGFTGSMALKSSFGNDTCFSQREMVQETDSELSLRTSACNPIETLFVVILKSGDYSKMETIDCRTETVYVDGSSMQGETKEDDGGEVSVI